MNESSTNVCLITGGTSGIGAAAALEIARTGATVVIVGRTTRRCIHRVNKIKRRVPGAQLDYFVADLSSQMQVRRLAAEFAARYPRLDILINNAGAYFAKRKVSVDGLEMNFALNHMAYFLLTTLLLDRLKESPSGRIVVVSSGAHANGKIEYDDLQMAQNYSLGRAYAQSKFANVLFTYALARRLEGTRITVNALHPGLVATNLGHNNNWLRTKMRNWLKRDILSPEEGAKTVVYLAVSPEVEGVSGKYFYECKAIPSSNESYVETNQEQLWQVSEKLTGSTH